MIQEEEGEPFFYTRKGFCKRFAISDSTFFREAKAGRIRITKIGKATRIARSDAESWASQLPVRKGGAA